MAAHVPRRSWAAPKQMLSLGPAFDKSTWESIMNYMTCGSNASADEIRDMINDAKTPVTLHVYLRVQAKELSDAHL